MRAKGPSINDVIVSGGGLKMVSYDDAGNKKMSNRGCGGMGSALEMVSYDDVIHGRTLNYDSQAMLTGFLLKGEERFHFTLINESLRLISSKSFLAHVFDPLQVCIKSGQGSFIPFQFC